ncbi:MAG: HAMP domain-containing histidine kinase [Acidimicrobiia bacterium]|nr:HAMP domain-containing histidine kinase [Acidimicrobiia bacterium]
MSHAASSGASASRGALLGGAAVALIALLAALALVFTNATGITRVAAESRTQQLAESALGASAAARNALGQALILTAAEPDSTILAAWVEEARLVLADLKARVDAVSAHTGSTEVGAAMATALAKAEETLAAIEAGDPVSAGETAVNEATPAFEVLTAALVVIRDDAARAIAAASLEAGSVATASRFMVALFMPSLALIVGLLLLRRRRRAEQMSAELERERSLNRSKDQLLANLSHELRTPLTGIYTSALTIDELGGSDPEIGRELNGLIIDQSADLTRMVEDLLASAQADAGRLTFSPVPTPVRHEIEGVIREFSRLPTKMVVNGIEAEVMADPGRLRQLLRNLLSNAVRHGGPRIAVDGTIAGDWYVLEVRDDGPGVPDDVCERLFERFVHQGDRPLTVGSVGLGLAICRVLAEGMGGSIAYRRESGYTVFSVLLPLARIAAPQAAA